MTPEHVKLSENLIALNGNNFHVITFEGTLDNFQDVTFVEIRLHVLLDFEVCVITHLKHLFDFSWAERNRNVFVAVDELSEDIISEFLEEFGMDMVEHAVDMYQGEYYSGADFAESLVDDCYGCGDLPSWVQVDWEQTWDYALSYDYTITDSGYVFNSNY